MAEDVYKPDEKGNLGLVHAGPRVGSDFGTASAVQSRMKGLGSKATSAFVPPKQNAGESASTYGERVRQAREAHRQKTAMSQ